MGILDEELHVLTDMDMDDYWGVVLDIMLQGIQIILFEPNLFDLREKLGSSSIMLYFGDTMHVFHSLLLKWSEIERGWGYLFDHREV